jgi:hypothetical protein
MRGVFSLWGHNLPTFRANQPIPTKRLNAAVEAIERSRPIVGQGSGLDVVQLPNGFDFRLAPGLAPPRVMVVTTSITKKVSTTAGIGAAKDAAFVRSTKALTTGAGVAIDVYSYHTDKSFNVGAVIAAFPWSGVLWAFDVDDCANLT